MPEEPLIIGDPSVLRAYTFVASPLELDPFDALQRGGASLWAAITFLLILRLPRLDRPWITS